MLHSCANRHQPLFYESHLCIAIVPEHCSAGTSGATAAVQGAAAAQLMRTAEQPKKAKQSEGTSTQSTTATAALQSDRNANHTCTVHMHSAYTETDTTAQKADATTLLTNHAG
jgi:hypothetical protein